MTYTPAEQVAQLVAGALPFIMAPDDEVPTDLDGLQESFSSLVAEYTSEDTVHGLAVGLAVFVDHVARLTGQDRAGLVRNLRGAVDLALVSRRGER